MKIIRRPRPHSFAKGTALTIGNFDGVHSGHAELFRRVVSAARAQDLVPTVVTLHPHPKEFFNPAFKLDRISTLRDRMIEMKRCGIEQVCILPFNKQMATLNPEAFVLEVLMQQLNARQIWVGDDFRFGAKRAGDFALLKKLGEEHGFTVNDLAEVQSDGSRVSSSNIREALKDIREASKSIRNASNRLATHLSHTGNVLPGQAFNLALAKQESQQAVREVVLRAPSVLATQTEQTCRFGIGDSLRIRLCKFEDGVLQQLQSELRLLLDP